METYFYYERDEDRRPYKTFCLVKAGDKIAKGIAICSEKDQCEKRKGKMIAQARALETILTGAIRFSGGRNYLLATPMHDVGVTTRPSPYLLSTFERKLLGFDSEAMAS